MSYQNVYRQASVNTATPGRLLIMLFDGLFRFINQGKVAIVEKNFETAHISLCRAQDIVAELRNTLAHEKAPELCANLNSLYDYFYRTLVDANVKKSPELLDEILPQIQELRDAFAEADTLSRAERGTTDVSHP